MPAKIDLTGQTYGRLTVIRPTENVDGKTAWLCRCMCGQTLVVKTTHLRRGSVRSCGCLTSAKGNIARLSYVDGTCLEMLRANTLRKNNTSGCPGVYWNKATQRWRVQIGFKGKHYTLGQFPWEEKEKAIAVRRAAEHQLFEEFLKQYALSPKNCGDCSP